MIVNGILDVLSAILNVVLLPLSPLSFVINLGGHLGVVTGFIKAVAYLFPWAQLTPLFVIVISIFGFRAIVALIKTIWDLIPIL